MGGSEEGAHGPTGLGLKVIWDSKEDKNEPALGNCSTVKTMSQIHLYSGKIHFATQSTRLPQTRKSVLKNPKAGCKGRKGFDPTAPPFLPLRCCQTKRDPRLKGW